MQRILKLAAPALVAMFVLGACGGQEVAPPASPKASFPMTVTNCGRQVTIEKRPERVIVFTSVAVSNIYAAGGTDKVVGLVEDPNAPYPPAIKAALKDVRNLGTESNLSVETVVAARPDVVIGYSSASINPDSLRTVGIPMLLPSGYCGRDKQSGTGDGRTDFEDVIGDVTLYGQLFGTEDKAAASIADLQRRVDAVKRRGGNARGRSAAMLDVSSKGVIYAVGRPSMAQTQLEILGFTNAFGDVDDYIFETSLEELIARNPDALVLLTYKKTPEEVKAILLGFSGITKVKAVQNDSIAAEPFGYAGPGVIAVDGLENAAEKLLPTK